MSDDAGTGEGMFAMWVGRLAAQVDEVTFRQVLRERQWEVSLEVAKDWNVDREEQGVAELEATNRGIERNRMFELLGYVESVSERFGVALAAGNEVALWRQTRRVPAGQRWELGRRELSQRAMASLFGFYLLATGHNLAAVAMRCLALEVGAHPSMDKHLGSACVPGTTTGKDHWPSLSRGWCGKLRRAARGSAHPSQLDLAEMVSVVARHRSWVELDEVRGVDYHRGRPTSAPMDGAPIGSAWIEGDGYRTFDWGRSTDGDNRAEETTALMMEVEQLLLSNLPTIRAQVDRVIADVLG